MDSEIQAMRHVIDVMDQALLDLINQRVALTKEIGSMKARAGLPCRDPQREAQLFLKISLSNSGPLSDQAARDIFALLLSESRRYQNQTMGGQQPSDEGSHEH